MSIYGFVINSIMLGVGLAMDAFSVSIANGLHAPDMKGGMKAKIAGTFAGFQFLMPMIGWLLVHYLLETFEQFQKWIPWIALALLLYIGGKMIFEAFQDDEESDGASERSVLEINVEGVNEASFEDRETGKEAESFADMGSESSESIAGSKDNSLSKISPVSNKELVIQGIATSIDALSVGFTIADYKCHMALLCSVIIAVVTYIICQIGLRIGIRVGMKLAKKASVFGGLILIFIGVEIFVRGVIL